MINNIKYEFIILSRSYWLVGIIVGVVFLLTFAAFNGNNNVAKRLKDITNVEQEFNTKDSLMLANLHMLESGKKLDLPYWQLPTEPMTIGYRYPRLAIMNPTSLAFVSTGQSDMYTHFKSPTVYGNNFALDYSEMVNPVQLLFGNFDLAYVIIYILPLLIIAFTYNILSKEKELGTLQLLKSHPISIVKWLFQKMLIRFIIFTSIVIVALLFIAIYFASSSINWSTLLGLLTLVVSYITFWFIVSSVINIKVNNSSKNAISLIGVWLIIVLILPASINQVSDSLYPTPSRLKMVNSIRLIKQENETKQNEIMDEYLKTHPELAKDSDTEKMGFWHRYFASEKMMEKSIKPLLIKYDSQLAQQQNLINNFKYLSPAIVLQQSLNDLSGTSEKHYNDYKKQVFEFSNEWREYLIPMLFKSQKFSSKNYKELPNFTYQNRIGNFIWNNVIVIFIINSLVLLLFYKTIFMK